MIIIPSIVCIMDGYIVEIDHLFLSLKKNSASPYFGAIYVCACVSCSFGNSFFCLIEYLLLGAFQGELHNRVDQFIIFTSPC